MPKKQLIAATSEFSNQAHYNLQQYQALYQQSIADPQAFWAEQASQFVTWYQTWDTVLQGDFAQQNVEWFSGAKLNACYNCVDRHLDTRGSQIAIIWEGNEPNESTRLTYSQLYEEICRFSNVLKNRGVKKGDRVTIYLPMTPDIVISMLACARIGAVHSVIFAGFSSAAIKSRINDLNCKLVITANEGVRGDKIIPLKTTLDTALVDCPSVEYVIVIQRTKNAVTWNQRRDYWYHEELLNASAECPCEEMDAQDPLFVLYTSGSTGKPKGILHTTGGYLVYAALTHYAVFDYQAPEVYWCTADCGWITGHTYIVYGPLCNGATTVLFEGIPNYPTPSRYWEIVDKHHVSIIYTSPTAIRALRSQGDKWVTQTSRQSLRIMGTVGEPINPDVWEWYYEVVGDSRCPIVDTWWQTETGGILISALPGATDLKPGSATLPLFGVKPDIVDDKGDPVPRDTMGKLVISQPWPGMMKTIYGDPTRFDAAYFKEFPGKYLTGDEARCDSDGYYWILGRFDDVLKVSGHRISTGEMENAFLQNPQVAEAAIVPVPHPIKGEAIYAFIMLKAGRAGSDDLKAELTQMIRRTVGPIATPEAIQWVEALPKTRSGKIMRRLLRKIAAGETKELGDTSTLADSQVIDKLIKGQIKTK